MRNYIIAVRALTSAERHSNWLQQLQTMLIQCAAKKYPLYFFAIFLATARNFYMKFHNLLLIHNYIKLLSSIVLFLITTK